MNLDEVLATVRKRFDFRKEIEIADIKFELGVLTLKEEAILNSVDSENLDAIAYFNESRKILLSFAIKKVNNSEIPDIVETKDEKGTLITQEKPLYMRSFVEKLPPAAVEDLFEAYIDLRDELETNLNKGMKYKWFKTPEVREEERKKKVAAASEEAKKEAEELKKEPEEKPQEDIVLRVIPDDRSAETEESEQPK